MVSQSPAKKFRDLGLVPTIQRLAVLEYLEKNHVHPTAEEVYQGVRKRYPSIAKATVYNVLDALKEAGAIQQLTITREAAHYDATTAPHPHFLCRDCGMLIDVELPCPIRPGDEILGHLIQCVNTYLYGVCKACRTKPERDKNHS
jgi:Fur family peroxide stress response transcriptional regulator